MKSGALLSTEDVRASGLTNLVEQVDRLVKSSGDPTDFDASAWVASWIERPVPALGNRCPKEFMDTIEGQKVVAQTLAAVGGGAYV